MDNYHEGHRKRLRMAYRERGAGALQEHQLLELLLAYAIPRRDVNPLSHALIERFGSLAQVLCAPPDELMRTDGVGEAAAVLISLAGTLGRTGTVLPPSRPVLKTPEDASRFCRELFLAERYEKTYCITLDARRRVLHTDAVSTGSVSENVIYPRVIAELAMRHGASGVILAHNHPSGTASPSRADIATTRTVCDALAGIGISLYDHIVCAGNETYSMLRNMLIPSGTAPEVSAAAADREDGKQ